MLLVALALLAAGGVLLWRFVRDPVIEPAGLAPLEHVEAPLADAAPTLPDTARPRTDGDPTAVTELSTRSAGPQPSWDGTLLVTGRVTDGNGMPSPGASIHVRESEDPEFASEGHEPFEWRAASDGAGEFSVQVDRQGEFVVWAEMGRTSSSQLASVSLNPRQPTAEVVLELRHGEAIEGVVMAEDMSPIAGCEVVAYVDVERSGIELPSGVTSVEVYGRPRTRTAQDGTFRLTPAFGEGVGYVVQAEQVRPVRKPSGDIAIAGFAASREHWRAETINVTPGSAPVSLVLRPPSAFSPTLRLKLTTDDGGALPPTLSCWLRHVGPHGGVYEERTTQTTIGKQGEILFPNILRGARYELILEERMSYERTTLGPFVAGEGELVLTATLSGVFDATLLVSDPNGRIEEDASLLIFHVAEGDHPVARRRVVARATLDPASKEFHALLPAGSYSAQVKARDSNTAGRNLALATHAFEMPHGKASFTIVVP